METTVEEINDYISKNVCIEKKKSINTSKVASIFYAFNIILTFLVSLSIIITKLLINGFAFENYVIYFSVIVGLTSLGIVVMIINIKHKFLLARKRHQLLNAFAICIPVCFLSIILSLTFKNWIAITILSATYSWIFLVLLIIRNNKMKIVFKIFFTFSLLCALTLAFFVSTMSRNSFSINRQMQVVYDSKSNSYKISSVPITIYDLFDLEKKDQCNIMETATINNLGTLPISTIGANAFSNIKSINHLILPENIKNIESGAFSNSSIEVLTIKGEYINIQNSLVNTNIQKVIIEKSNCKIDVEVDSINEKIKFVVPKDSINQFREENRTIESNFVPNITDNEIYINYNDSELETLIIKKDKSGEVIIDLPSDIETEKTINNRRHILRYYALEEGKPNDDRKPITFPYKTNVSLNLYAYWEPIYNVSYELNGAIIDEKNLPAYYWEGIGELSLPSSMEKPIDYNSQYGYSFMGWYDENNRKVLSIDETANTDIKLTAKFCKNYAITYKLNNGDEDETILYNEMLLPFKLSTSYSRKGYTFNGWYETEGLSSKKVEQITKILGNKVYEAKWSIIHYSITYKNTGNSINDNVIDYTIEDDDITLSDLNRTGYTFDGWYLDDQFKEKIDGIAIQSGTIGKQIFYANWLLNPAEIGVCENLNKIYNGIPEDVFVKTKHDASNIEFSYEWYRETYDDCVATSSTIQVSNVNESSIYYCVITSTDGMYSTTQQSQSVVVNIQKAEYDMSGIEFTDKEVEYNGQAQNIEIKGQLPIGADGIGVTVEYIGSATNVEEGQQLVTAKFSTTSKNYNVPKEKTAYITILPTFVEINWTKDNFIYDGTNQASKVQASYVNVGDQTIVLEVTGPEMIEYNETGYSFMASLGNPNYQVLSSELEHIYHMQKAEYDMSRIQFANKEVKYNGQAQSIEIKGQLPIGADGIGVTVEYIGSATNVGEGQQLVTARFSTTSKNYNVPKEKKAYITIKPTFVEINWTEDNFIYDGTNQASKVQASYVNVGGQTIVLEVTGPEMIEHNEAGYPFVASISDSNYTASLEHIYHIQKAEYDMSGIEFADKEVEYNGQAQSIVSEGQLPIGADGIGVTVEYVGSATNVVEGKQLVTAKFSTTSKNYNVPKEKTAYITILPKQVKINWTEDNFIYDGTNQASKVQASYVNVGGQTIMLEVTGPAMIEYNETGYSFMASLGNPNYQVLSSELEHIYHIQKAEYDMSGIEFADKEVEYNGQAQSIVSEGQLPIGADGIGVTVEYVGSATNVVEGKQLVTAKFSTTSKNYNVPKEKTAYITILPKDITNAEVIVEEKTLVYTGDELYKEIVSVKLGEFDVTYKVNNLSAINVGVHTMEISGIGNFSGSVEENFEIKPAEITDLCFITYNGVYDGEYHDAVLSYIGKTVNSQPLKFEWGLTSNEFSELIPKIKEAGYYYIYCKVSAPNHKEVIQSMQVIIEEAGDLKNV